MEVKIRTINLFVTIFEDKALLLNWYYFKVVLSDSSALLTFKGDNGPFGDWFSCKETLPLPPASFSSNNFASICVYI
jgi:hypothetical protein